MKLFCLSASCRIGERALMDLKLILCRRTLRPLMTVIGLYLLSQPGAAQEQPQAAAKEESRKVPPVVRVEIIEDPENTEFDVKAAQRSAAMEDRNVRAQEGMYAEAKRVSSEATYQTWLTGIGALLVFSSLLLALRANKAARDAVAVTREVGDRQLRPYILSDGLEVVDTAHVVDGHHGWNVVFKWRNHGHTPTVNAVTRNYVMVFDSLPDTDFAYEADIDDHAAPIAIGPGAIQKTRGPSVSSKDVARMMAGQAHILVWGFVEYSDRATGGPRFRSEYCVEIIDGKPRGNKWSFVQHGPFNGWDDECMYPPQSG